MAKMKRCPVCGGFHRKKTQFKKCYEKANPPKWTLKEIGKSRSRK